MLNNIHYKEVVKLYPDSIFPHFDVIKRENSMIEVVYHSERNLPYLAKGMLEGCIEYFNEALTVEMQDDAKKKEYTFHHPKSANMNAELSLLHKRLEREKNARHQADILLEQKSLQLWEANHELKLNLDEKSKELQGLNSNYRIVKGHIKRTGRESKSSQ